MTNLRLAVPSGPALEPGDGVTYRFDGFTLDTQTRRLLRDGQEVHLSPKAFELLLVLIENRSRAMARADLHAHLWPSTFVLDTNLAGLVAEVRRALSDTADTPTFIRTMHGFGYWFIANVHEDEAREKPMMSPVRYWLVWDTRQMPLSEGENIIGRGPDAGVWIDARGVSRHHARILVQQGDVLVEDLGSKNGTYVGAQRVTRAMRLSDGDQVRLGSVVITFRIPQHPGSTETAAYR